MSRFYRVEGRSVNERFCASEQKRRTLHPLRLSLACQNAINDELVSSSLSPTTIVLNRDKMSCLLSETRKMRWMRANGARLNQMRVHLHAKLLSCSFSSCFTSRRVFFFTFIYLNKKRHTGGCIRRCVFGREKYARGGGVLTLHC